MKKIILFIAFIGINFLLNSVALNAQNVGLQWQNIKPKTTAVGNQNDKQDYTPQLRLPKVNNPIVKVRQNQFYSQSSYHQVESDKSGFANHYKLMNNQLNLSQQDLFAGRLIEVAISKIFKLD
jgi:hypothetical protein